MATMEQCKAALSEQCKTKQDVEEFGKLWPGGTICDEGWSDTDFIRENIDRIVKNADVEGKLDRLGMKLGLPSDDETERLNTIGTNRRSWIAIAIAAGALIISAAALVVSLTAKM